MGVDRLMTKRNMESERRRPPVIIGTGVKRPPRHRDAYTCHTCCHNCRGCFSNKQESRIQCLMFESSVLLKSDKIIYSDSESIL